MSSDRFVHIISIIVSTLRGFEGSACQIGRKDVLLLEGTMLRDVAIWSELRSCGSNLDRIQVPANDF